MVKEIYICSDNFIIDLGFDLPTTAVSKGAAWHNLCEHRSLSDHIKGVCYKFQDVVPENYESYTQYTAAYQLCRYAAGIDKEGVLEDTFKLMALCKAVLFSKEDSPLRYYDCFYHKFLYLLALNTRSKWAEQFNKQSDLSDAFYLLNNRSYIQVIEAFTWLYGFFYDLSCKVCPTNPHELADAIMWLSPEVHIASDSLLPIYLTNDVFGVSCQHLSTLAKCAAGVYRLNEREKAKEIYCWCFNTANNSALSIENKHDVISSFMSRLEYGYENEVFDVDIKLVSLLEEHISKFKNRQWVESHTHRLSKYRP